MLELTLKLLSPVAEFLDPGWGDKVDSGIGLSYRLAGLLRLVGRYDNPMPESTLSPSQGSTNSAKELRLLYISLKPFFVAIDSWLERVRTKHETLIL